MLTLLGFLLLFAGGSCIFPVSKLWTGSTNYDNKRNLLGGQLPCAKDRVIFQKHVAVSLFMPKAFSFSEMVLPMNAEIILQSDTNVLVNGDNSNSKECSGEDIYYKVHEDSWYDPKMWKINSLAARPFLLDSYQDNSAVPHAFRIPCHLDNVVFPVNSSFQVHLDSARISISTMTINGLRYGKSDFEGLLASSIGRLLFPNDPQIDVTGSICMDDTGCACFNDDSQILSKVCSHVTCVPVQCADPIRITGHCCSICASYLNIVPDVGFTFSDLILFYNRNYFSQPEYHSVDAFTFKTRENRIQTVVVDSSSNKGLASKISERIRNDVIRDKHSANTLKIQSVELFSSVRWYSETPWSSSLSGEGMSPGGVAGIIIVIILISGAIVSWYMYKKRQLSGFLFARFDLQSAKVSLELGTTPHDDLDPDDRSIPVPSSSFDNPVYDTIKELQLPTSRIRKDEPLIDPTCEEDDEDEEDEKNIVENPMFNILDSNDNI